MCSCAPNDPTKPAESNPASSTETLSGVSSEASSEPFTMSIFQFMPEYSVELQQMYRPCEYCVNDEYLFRKLVKYCQSAIIL